MNEVWDAAICFAMANISLYARAKARDVSLTRVMISLVTEGMMVFMTCGRMILKKVWVLL